ncbi:helicase associated domain-containing protein [Streptomyces nigrescens]
MKGSRYGDCVLQPHQVESVDAAVRALGQGGRDAKAKEQGGGGGGSGGPSAPAKALLKFSTPCDPAALAACINLRVLKPEREHWRRGVEAAVIYAREHGDLRVPFTYRVPAGEDAEAEGWPASLADFPLGQWTTDARLAPLDAAFQGAAVGIWLKNARAAARKAVEIERRRAEGLPVESSAGAMSQERREQLEEIDASWCPVWPVTWQRCFHLVRQHLDEGGTLPTDAGDVVRQGEDLGRWVTSVRPSWDKLTTVQQWMCEQVLGIEPATEDEKPKPRTSQADKWAANLAAARQFFEREGHLQVPRKHVETVLSEDGWALQFRLGAWVSNQRSRAATLTPERVEQLSEVGMRWS